MQIIGIIPARMASTRFPGKPLALIHGMPMIGHVWHRCRRSELLDEVYVATCDREIMDYVGRIGGEAVMTKDTHERCTERTAEALGKVEAAEGVRPDIIVVIQGDLPMTTPEMIDAAVRPMLADPSIRVVNLMAELKTPEEYEDPNEVKVVVNLESNALYFSREPVPSRKKAAAPLPIWMQVGIMPFRREFLLQFDTLATTPLEIAESVDMLRVLEHGYDVRMVPIDAVPYSVDTEMDRQRVEHAMANDETMKTYL